MSPNEARTLKVGDVVQLASENWAPLFEVIRNMQHGCIHVREYGKPDHEAGKASVRFSQIYRKVAA